MSAETHPRVLRLTLTRRWFEMVASNEKKAEYREPGPWIYSRLEGKEYDVVEFTNGYGKDLPRVVVQYQGWDHSFGLEKWGGGGEQGEPKVTIYLGDIISLTNWGNFVVGLPDTQGGMAWLAGYESDPTRYYTPTSALCFMTKGQAEIAIEKARTCHPTRPRTYTIIPRSKMALYNQAKKSPTEH